MLPHCHRGNIFRWRQTLCSSSRLENIKKITLRLPAVEAQSGYVDFCNDDTQISRSRHHLFPLFISKMLVFNGSLGHLWLMSSTSGELHHVFYFKRHILVLPTTLTSFQWLIVMQLNNLCLLGWKSRWKEWWNSVFSKYLWTVIPI